MEVSTSSCDPTLPLRLRNTKIAYHERKMVVFRSRRATRQFVAERAVARPVRLAVRARSRAAPLIVSTEKHEPVRPRTLRATSSCFDERTPLAAALQFLRSHDDSMLSLRACLHAALRGATTSHGSCLAADGLGDRDETDHQRQKADERRHWAGRRWPSLLLS